MMRCVERIDESDQRDIGIREGAGKKEAAKIFRREIYNHKNSSGAQGRIIRIIINES
jgi:hypothetical protein